MNPKGGIQLAPVEKIIICCNVHDESSALKVQENTEIFTAARTGLYTPSFLITLSHTLHTILCRTILNGHT